MAILPLRQWFGLKASQGIVSYLFLLPDSSTEVIMKLVQRWAKNNKDPETPCTHFTVLIAPTELQSQQFDFSFNRCTNFDRQKSCYILPAFRSMVRLGRLEGYIAQ